MYRTITDFLTDWQEESEATLKVFSHLDETKLNEKVSDNVRSLGRLAWHIVQTLTEMGARAGLFPEDTLEHTPIPTRVVEITKLYHDYAQSLSNNVKDLWKNEMLNDKLNMYGSVQ
ncbi:MAG: DinB family protein [Saprospiraceae bacterium]